jgi:hypothetical protein
VAGSRERGNEASVSTKCLEMRKAVKGLMFVTIEV